MFRFALRNFLEIAQIPLLFTCNTTVEFMCFIWMLLWNWYFNPHFWRKGGKMTYPRLHNLAIGRLEFKPRSPVPQPRVLSTTLYLSLGSIRPRIGRYCENGCARGLVRWRNTCTVLKYLPSIPPQLAHGFLQGQHRIMNFKITLNRVLILRVTISVGRQGSLSEISEH